MDIAADSDHDLSAFLPNLGASQRMAPQPSHPPTRPASQDPVIIVTMFAVLASKYGLTVDDDLASILPPQADPEDGAGFVPEF